MTQFPRTEGSPNVNVVQTVSYKFTTPNGTAFSLCGPLIVGRIATGNKKVPFAVSFNDVFSVYVRQAARGELARLKGMIEAVEGAV